MRRAIRVVFAAIGDARRGRSVRFQIPPPRPTSPDAEDGGFVAHQPGAPRPAGYLPVPTRPWESLLGRYRDLEGRDRRLEPTRRLVEHVAAQPYGTSQFATTSMHALLVAQQPQIEGEHDVLRIEVSRRG